MVAALLVGVVVGRIVEAEEATLRLATGSQTTAEVLAGSRPDAIRFTMPLTVGTIEAPLDTIASLQYPQHRSTGLPPESSRRFELWGEDVLAGELVMLTADKCVVEVPGIGSIQLPREAVRRISQAVERQNLVELGIGADEAWQVLTPAAPWQLEAGKLVADQPRATIYHHIDLPMQAAIELVVSWEGSPDFVIALGTDGGPSHDRDSFRLEVWDDSVVLVREAGEKADLAWLGEAPTQPRSLRLSLFLDQEAGKLIVLDQEAKRLGQLEIPLIEYRATQGVQLTSRSGTTRLERLRVQPWDGTLPQPAADAESWVRLADHSMQPGDAFLFDRGSKLIVRSRDGNQTYDPGEVSEVVLSTEPSVPPRAAATVQAKLRHGMRLSGKLVAMGPDELSLAIPGGTQAVAIPLQYVTRLAVIDPDDDIPWPGDLRPARLESGSIALEGGLEDGLAGERSVLHWHIRGTRAARPLRADLSGRILFNASPDRATVGARRPVPAPAPAAARFPRDTRQRRHLLGHAIYLHSGDVVPAEVVQIDVDGLHVESTLVESAIVPNQHVQAVVLWDGATAPTLDELRRDRLLRLPRAQASRPPTHLLGSKDGDYLRCRLLSMDGESIQIESRGDVKRIDRRYIAWIVWLAERPADSGEDNANATPVEMRVQANRRDGLRLTMHGPGVEQGVLRGSNPVFGECQIPVAEVDALLLNGAIDEGAIDEAAARSPFDDWRLEDSSASAASTSP